MPEEPVQAAFERRIVSVLFADLVGFTSLSERLDPEDVATVQDAYFATVRETVTRHGGQLEKFIGDAAMAVFGVPRARDDDAERAIRAGLALVGAVEALGARLGLEAGEAALRLRVGVNSGEVVSAESGPDRGRVTGDTVNLASRLQTAAEPGSVLVGELTQLAAADAVAFEPMGALELKGKTEPVPAWRVVGLRPEPSREEALGALRAPLLGRKAELERLAAGVDRVGERQATEWLVIVAPPGVGKSRLLAEFAAHAEAAGAGVLRARVRADILGPADPVSQVLLSALQAAGGASRETAPRVVAAALREAGASNARTEVVTSEVVETLWPPSVAAAAPPDRDARFGSWLDALDALAGERATTWLIEDIHWAGPDLLAFLERAGREPARGGRLVVATARPSVLEQLPEGTEVLELPPLAAVNAAELVQALVGEALPDSLIGEVAERSDGNPLFIEELLRSWISGGTLAAGVDGGWELAVPPNAVPLPPTVQAIYAAQLDDLPPAARLVARRASVAGRRFAVRALEPLEIADPEDGIASLRGRAFLRGPEMDLAGEEVYAYRHALLRDAGYASLSRADRGRFHLALATWLEQTAGPDVSRVAEPIASHYESALAAMPALGADAADSLRLADAARTWLERAADAALAVAAHEAAIELLARALRLAGDEREAARVRLRRGELMTAAGDMAAGMDEIGRALETYRTAFLADRSDRPARDGYGHATAAMGTAMIEQIRFIEARDLVAATLADIGDEEDPVTGRLLALHAWSKVSQGDHEGTVDEVERAREMVRGADPRIEVEVLSRRAMIQSESGIGGDWDSLEQAARASGMWREAVGAILLRAGNAVTSPRGAVLADIATGLDLANSHGLVEVASRARYFAVEERLQIGDWDTALAEGFGNLEITERNAYHRSSFRTWIAIAPILGARGDRESLDRYRRWHLANRSMFPDPPSPYGQVHLAALDRLLAGAGVDLAYMRDITPEIVGTETYTNPDYVAAVEVVVGSWMAGGQTTVARTALQAISRSWLHPAEEPSPLMRASLALTEVWLARAETADGITQRAREAAALSRDAEAPWWVVRAIRALPEGAATADELAEAEAIERQLGVREGAAAPPL